MSTDHPVELKPDHCGISVPDLQASIAWYQDMLGFSVERRLVIEAVGAKIAFLKHGDFRIELFEVRGAAPMPDDRRYPNLDLRTHGTKHIAFSVRDLRKVINILKQRGADIAMDVMRVEDIEVAFIRDNSGTLIELMGQPDL